MNLRPSGYEPEEPPECSGRGGSKKCRQADNAEKAGCQREVSSLRGQPKVHSRPRKTSGFLARHSATLGLTPSYPAAKLPLHHATANLAQRYATAPSRVTSRGYSASGMSMPSFSCNAMTKFKKSMESIVELFPKVLARGERGKVRLRRDVAKRVQDRLAQFGFGHRDSGSCGRRSISASRTPPRWPSRAR